ncbi:PRC-barrel domain-containing protein [Oceanicola sp. S124]|uniref:PRC-barrel domain-containing protein n=1 Tax=Oceanicola sp. S124 TaxID=1042378 RepID=UPI0002559C66|nr:PRC-barrel domain-containing protein [Oceanicola sp. S124]
MKTLIASTSRTALLALALAAPVVAPIHAVAQDAQVEGEAGTDPLLVPEGGDTGAEMTTDPMAPTDGDVAEAPGTPDPMADPMATEGTDVAEAEEAPKPVEGQITMQDKDSILAADLIGAPVYNGQDEKVGDINDLIIALGGNVEGVVIGVGGFLGLGEKDVAIEMAQLDVATSEGDVQRLVTSASRADLESAPEFVTAQEQAREAEALQMQSDTTGGATIPVE